MSFEDLWKSGLIMYLLQNSADRTWRGQVVSSVLCTQLSRGCYNVTWCSDVECIRHGQTPHYAVLGMGHQGRNDYNHCKAKAKAQAKFCPCVLHLPNLDPTSTVRQLRISSVSLLPSDSLLYYQTPV